MHPISLILTSLLLSASASPLASKQLSRRAQATINLFEGSFCDGESIDSATVLDTSNINTGCLPAIGPFDSVAFSGDFSPFQIWEDELCLQPSTIVPVYGHQNISNCFGIIQGSAVAYSFTNLSAVA